MIKCWDVVSGKLEYELNSGDPVGNRDNSPRGYIKISRNKKWLGVKVQESLSSGMSIKLHIFDLDDPQKPPICLLPDVTHQVLSYFTFSDDSKCVALICDNKHVYFYDLSGKLLSRYVLRNLYANNELHFAERQSSVYIFSYDYNPFFYGEGFDECSEYDDNPIEGDEDRHGIPCVICKLCTATGETTELHTFYGAAETIPTVSYIPGTDAFLIYDGDKKQIEHFNCCTMKRTPIFMSVSPEAQEPPAALHLYADNPTICLLMYSDYAYLCDYEKELSGQYGILKQFTTSGIQKKLKEKGLGVDLHFSTNVAPSDNHFLVFDENNKTYEWDSESDIVRARYNSAFYDTAYLAVSSGRDNAFLVHAYNGISQFASDPLVLHYQHCYREKGYSVNVGASDELRNQLALAFADVGHEKVIVVDLDTYAERLIFSTMKPSETITDLCFSDEGEKILITTQYRCVEFDFKTEHEATVAQSTGKERFTYGNYSGGKIEIVVVEESEEGLPTRCEYYSKTEIDGKVEFQKEWYYVIPQLPEKLYKYFVHGNGDFGKEGLRGENGIQKYWLTRGFFLEDWSEFEPVMLLECYRRSGDDFVMSKVQFKRLDMICVRHESTLAPTRNRKNSITYMYLNIENNEAIFFSE